MPSAARCSLGLFVLVGLCLIVAHAKAQLPLGPSSAKVIVCPFRTLQGDANSTDLGAGISARLMLTLGDLEENLRIIEPTGINDILRSQDQDLTPSQVARISRATSATVCITGRCQIVGNRLRIDVRILDGSSGHALPFRDLSVEGPYPDSYFSLVDQLAGKLDTSLQAIANQSPPSSVINSGTANAKPEMRRVTSGRARLPAAHGEPNTGVLPQRPEESGVVFVNHSPYPLKVVFYSSNGEVAKQAEVGPNSQSGRLVLSPGTYKVEATTEGGRQTGSFPLEAGDQKLVFSLKLPPEKFVISNSTADLMRVQVIGTSIDVVLNGGQRTEVMLIPGLYALTATATGKSGTLVSTFTVRPGYEGQGMNITIERKGPK